MYIRCAAEVISLCPTAELYIVKLNYTSMGANALRIDSD